MEERKRKLMNDSIRAIKDFCNDLDIDCSEEYCPFSVNCPMHTAEPPCNWVYLEKDEK